jgi:hypothetical protein
MIFDESIPTSFVSWSNGKAMSVDLEKKKVYFNAPKKEAEVYSALAKAGLRTVIRELQSKTSELIQSTTSGTLSWDASDFVLPTNADAAADIGLHYLIKIALLFGKNIKTVQNVNLPEVEVTESAQKNLLTLLASLYSSLKAFVTKGDENDTKIPYAANLNVVSGWGKFLAHQWASRNGMLTYMSDDIKSLSGSLKEWTSLISSLGIPMGQGHLLDGLSTSLFRLAAFVASQKNVHLLIPSKYFGDIIKIRQSSLPKIKISKEDPTDKKKKIEELKTLDVFHFDRVRFLFPEERRSLKTQTVFGQIMTTEAKLLDTKPNLRTKQSLDNYVKLVKNLGLESKSRYFDVRRNSRKRMYAIKKVLSSQGIKDRLDDSDFSSVDILHRALELVDKTNFNDEAKVTIKGDLSRDVFASQKDESSDSSDAEA